MYYLVQSDTKHGDQKIQIDFLRKIDYKKLDRVPTYRNRNDFLRISTLIGIKYRHYRANFHNSQKTCHTSSLNHPSTAFAFIVEEFRIARPNRYIIQTPSN